MNNNYQSSWNKSVIRIGTLTMAAASITMFAPLIYLCISQNTFPTISNVLKAWSMSIAAWGVFYFVEPITYYAVIGLSGTYLGFLAGNVGNVRIPCAATALEVTGVEAGTPQGEIIATLGMSGSVVTNIFFTTLAATSLLAVLPQPVVDAFSKYTVPAIFGAIIGQNSMKNLRVGSFSIAIAFFLKVVVKPSSYIEMLLCVFIVVLFARFIYVNDAKKAAKKTEQTAN